MPSQLTGIEFGLDSQTLPSIMYTKIGYLVSIGNPELEIYGLPPHLHNEERCQLQAVPELLVEKSTAQGSTLALFLHGNFPPFFKKLEDYSNAAESLSYADYIASQWTVSFPTFFIK